MSLDLTTKRDRIRLGVGDTDDAAPLIPGGLSTYTALLSLNNGDEVATWRAAAGALAAYYATTPDRIASAGDSLAWSARVSQWNRIADGLARYPYAQAAGGLRGLHVGGAGLDPMFRRDSLGTDPVLDPEAGDGA